MNMIHKMDETEIRLLINQNEGETLEFKQFGKLENINDKKKKDLAKLFVALANTKGGLILFGVTDNRKFEDYNLTEDNYKLFTQKLVQIANSNCNPPIYLEKIQQINVDKHNILSVEVPVGMDSHAVSGKFYIRIHDQNIEITDPKKIVELFDKKREKNQDIIIKKEEKTSSDATLINEYLNLIINEENTIIHDDIEFGICEVYTELSAKLPKKKILPITVRFDETEKEREEESGVFELVEKEKKLIISGVSGSGKTITLKWLNVTFAKKCLGEDDCSIPLYIGLNTYRSGDFYNYVRIKAKEKGVTESTLKLLLLNGKLIFLIDGLDLLSSTVNFKPYTEISNFISEYSECRYVISSRPGFYEEIQNKFRICKIEELDEPKTTLFINNYITDEKLANAVTKKILDNDIYKSLLKNPMMLYLALVVIKSRMEEKIEIDKIIPSNRSDLYKIFIPELFKHNKRKGKSLNSDKVQILETLTNIYFKLQCKNQVDCDYSDTFEIAMKHSYDNDQQSAKYILDDLFNLGLLIKEESIGKDDQIKYGIHQSFQEYFAALKLKNYFEKNYDLSPFFKHPKWEEVVIFAAEMFDCPDEFINQIINSCEVNLASKCAQNASIEIKEKLCKFLAEKIDSAVISLEITDAIESLGRLGDVGISIIIEALTHESSNVQMCAIYTLGETKSDKAINPLKGVLNEKSDFDVLKYAIFAFEKIKSDKAVNFLIGLLDHEARGIRSMAAEALGKKKSDKAVDSLIVALDDLEWKVLTEVVYALGEIKSDKAINSLIIALGDGYYDVQRDAVDALVKIKSDKAVNSLIVALDDENPYVRCNAAEALGEIKSDKAVDSLIIALNDEKLGVRLKAAEALGEIKSDKAVYYLKSALPNWTAAYLLGKIKSDKAVNSLIGALDDEDYKGRWSAAYALGEIKSDKAINSLIVTLNDENPDVRCGAVEALGKIKSGKAINSLIVALCDENPIVRERAAYALGKIKSDSALNSLIGALDDEVPVVRKKAAEALGKIKSDKAINSLIVALDDKDPEVLESAISALGKIKSNKAVNSLIVALGNENGFVQRSAAESLVKIKSDKAINSLIVTLNDENPDVREIAAEALGEIKSDKAFNSLIVALSDENRYVRRSAADALGKIKSDKAFNSLLVALDDEDFEVPKKAANALREIITIKNKHLMEPLLESEKGYIAKFSYSILKEINRNERSEQKITLENISISEKGETNRLENQQKPCGEPAEKGLQDSYIGGFIDRLKSIEKSTTIVDYGCGQGKLFCALTSLPVKALNNISLIGVDEKTRCRYTSRLTAEKYGLFKLLKQEPKILKPKDFNALDIKLDYVFLMHALHEIKLLDLVEIIYSISIKLKKDGRIFILDQRELIEKERSYVLWDDEKDFETLFLDSGLKVYQRFFNTGSDKKLSSIEVKKVKGNYFSKEKVGINCLKVYENKKINVSGLLDRKEVSDDKYQELSNLYSNISRQLDEYYNFTGKSNNY